MTSSTLSPAAATPASTAAPVASERALPVTFDAVSKAFGSATVLRDITLDVRPGEVLAILGPSGCGKSTLLRAVSGLDPPPPAPGGSAAHR